VPQVMGLRNTSDSMGSVSVGVGLVDFGA
jgi:hypothetical protein